MSGFGKSSLAYALDQSLFNNGCSCYVLNGDNIKSGLSSDLGFSANDRSENISRVAEVAKLLVDFNAIVLVAFISPYEADRAMAKKINGDNHFD